VPHHHRHRFDAVDGGHPRTLPGAGRGDGRSDAAGRSGEGIPDEAVTPFLADLSESAGCTDLLAEVTDRLGAVDGLVNCAGVMRRGDLLEIDEDDWAATYAVNVDAVMR